MTELVERITTIFLPRGRPTEFTPARIQQIRTLVERGKSREEIAELIGVTVGSLQVTCSVLRKLVFEAHVRGMRFGELVGTLITAAMERDPLRQASYTEHGRF